MSDKRSRKKSSITSGTRKYEQNKQNILDQLDPFETSKDILERVAKQELNDLSDIEFKKIDFISKVPRGFAEEISGWNQPPPATKIHNFRSSSDLKPKSACRHRTVATRATSCSGRSAKIHLKTAVQTSGDEVLVCKPIVTEPVEPSDSFNIIFQHKPVQSIVLTKQTKQPSDSNNLYNIIKSIEAQNSKLLRKLFRQLHQNPYYEHRIATKKNSNRPASSIRRQKSKQNVSQKDELRNNTQSVFNFILCNQKGMMPNSLRTAKPQLKDIRRQAIQSCPMQKCIFYPTQHNTNKFALRTKLAANSLSRHK